MGAPTTAEVAPVADKARLEVLDAIRGFALCGILLINLPHMGWLMEADEPVRGVRDGGASTFLWWSGELFVAGTMRGLFSLLFGASMLLFLAKAERGSATNAQAYRLMLRRLWWLLLFGVLDMTLLLWPGDILNIYAMAGLAILPFAAAKPRTLAIGAAIALAGVSVYMVAHQLPKQQIIANGPVIEAKVAAGQAVAPADKKMLERWQHWQTGQFTTPEEVAAERAVRLGGYAGNFGYLSKMSWQWFLDWQDTLRWVFDAVGFMLVGMILYRLRWLQGDASRGTYAILIIVGYGMGLPLKSVGAFADWRLFMGGGAEFWQFWVPALTMQAARLLVTLGHVGLFLWLWKTVGWRLRPLQALGRMAFTGYLGQSILGAIAFSGFGLALWGRLSLAELWVACAIIWAIEIAFAVVWLSRFSMGPFEWVWRALTYGHLPPMLRAARVPQPA
jgi:uncharacterized protein